MQKPCRALERTKGFLCAAIAIACAFSAVTNAAAKNAAAKNASGAPSKIRLVGAVNELVMVCAASGITLADSNLPSRIMQVRLGSTAAYAGVKVGDRVLDGKIDNNVLTMTVQRGKEKFQARMATDSKSLKSLIAAPAPAPRQEGTLLSKPPLTGEIGEDEMNRILSEYDFTLVVDRSGSMDEPAGEGTATKLQWVQAEIVEFSKFLDGQNATTTNLITFNASHSLQVGISPRQVTESIRNLNADGGTNLADPLKDSIDLARTKTRPQMIVVLTDGMPNLGPSLEQLIVDTANSMHKNGDVVLSFLQVGNDVGGAQQLRSLDRDLSMKGAKYDIVDTKYFPELLQHGLKRSLADALFKARARTPAKSSP